MSRLHHRLLVGFFQNNIWIKWQKLKQKEVAIQFHTSLDWFLIQYLKCQDILLVYIFPVDYIKYLSKITLLSSSCFESFKESRTNSWYSFSLIRSTRPYINSCKKRTKFLLSFISFPSITKTNLGSTENVALTLPLQTSEHPVLLSLPQSLQK